MSTYYAEATQVYLIGLETITEQLTMAQTVVKKWALKRTELRPLSDTALIVVAARCAERAASVFAKWWPDAPASARSSWKKGLDAVERAIAGSRASEGDAEALMRQISNAGASGFWHWHDRDEDRGHMVNRAFTVLSTALRAASDVERKEIVSAMIETGTHLGSLAAMMAHAKMVPQKRGAGDPVDLALSTIYAAIRHDIGLASQTASDEALAEALGPLWSDGKPTWWP